jgi:hypothetical protein
VTRSDPLRGELPARAQARRRAGKLISVLGPVAVGVAVAFAWNGAAASLQADQAASMGGVAPQVSVTVQQAAVQAWVNAVATQGPGRARPRPRIDLQPSTRAYTPDQEPLPATAVGR